MDYEKELRKLPLWVKRVLLPVIFLLTEKSSKAIKSIEQATKTLSEGVSVQSS